ncbi:MAG: hypothetical protein IJS52_02955 [Bacilli bacterium]|nr:hypothetical protein [Bacilli bacterium]
MSPIVVEVTPGAVRSKYASLFSCVASIADLRYGKRPSTKFDDIVAMTETLKDDGYLNDYLYESLVVLFKTYPCMMPGKKQEPEKLHHLYELLGITIGDLCAEISDLEDDSAKHDREYLIKSLLG